jgi:hypothetical protein
MQIFRGLALSSLALLAWGCAVDADPDRWSVAARSSPMGTFELAENRLAFNRLAFNRLAFNRLAFNRIAFNRLAFNSLDSLETSEEGRELLLYIARCALAEGDVLVATVDQEEYEFPGLLGLAVEWEHRALEPAEARRVSACLITHVNAFDVSVQISLRAPGYIVATPEEAFDFPVYEATFFGDVFGDELLTYACLGNDTVIAGAHAPDRPLRVCADPGPDCPVVELGHCRDVCDSYVPGTGWTECWAGGALYAETVSSYLRSDGESCRAICNGSDFFCHLLCPSSATPSDPLDDLFPGRRILDCKGHPDMCTSSCRGSECLLEASGTGMAFVTALDGAEADISCVDAGTCLTDCKGPNTRCEIDCTGADDCTLTRCDLGARCLVDCTGTGACEIEHCQGQIRSCANDVLVCNRPCPEG